jgi:outer membrane protein insertion porin family
MYKTTLITLWSIFLLTLSLTVQAQIDIDNLPVWDYSEQTEYEIGGISVAGTQYTDEASLIKVTGLEVGDKIRIPGPQLQSAIKALWRLQLFTDVTVVETKTIGKVIFLEIRLKELPRLSRYSYVGVKKSYHDDLNKEVEKFVSKGKIVTENVKANGANAIRKFFTEKGFLDTKVEVKEYPDDKRVNAVRIEFDVARREKVKIQDIIFVGNENASTRKLRKKMEKTKRKKALFKASKMLDAEYENDKREIVKYYNTLGYRDARIVRDSVWREKDGDLQVMIFLEEGQKYFIRNIAFKGNSIYDTKTLNNVLGLKKGDVYNTELLETRLRFSQDGRDVSTLYMDNGYLFFNVDPVETAVFKDSIDLEMRIYEGPQATIDKVVIKGNDRTNEHVIRRELRTKPGEKFSRSEIVRSQREIINLGYFNQEALKINTPVNPQRGTVDIEYTVEEKSSDQLELSAGWSGGFGVVGTLGVTFNNFSIGNIFKKEAWNPLPQGDGQRLSLRVQSTGRFYQAYNFSFTEPWLGGKKPNSLTVAGAFTRFTNGTAGTSTFGFLETFNFSAGLGTRLKWPDDNFISSTSLQFQSRRISNFSFINFITDKGETVNGGKYYQISLNQTIARSTISDPLFPKEGSKFSLNMQLTPPYSLFRKGPVPDNLQDQYRWVEYHKWRVDAEWYTPLFDKFVLRTAAKIGIMGRYSKSLGVSPFDRWQLTGNTLNAQQFNAIGVDFILLRGYSDADLENNFIRGSNVPTPIFDKFTMELRYPISLNPSSTIYVMGFMEGGNSWRYIRDFNPFDVKRSAGLGLRVFLPMFGVLGFDYGFGFDKTPSATATNLFSKYGQFNIILGFEPD